MSRLPPIPARAAATPAGQSALRAFERLCEIEADVDTLERDLSTLQAASRITALIRNIKQNRDRVVAERLP